ncbi:hypothetical protein JCM17846_08620 [Iodidimonas nitroreducens]|uniref:Uncharacterized protein n=1 Tax=Iodidimonas nitroreducens TaxID=1236968 RepID=A0A5A7N733_9PROT|nr:hypothetical protein JCM17846_08620 [Iodidimonas nitroreducens]
MRPDLSVPQAQWGEEMKRAAFGWPFFVFMAFFQGDFLWLMDQFRLDHDRHLMPHGGRPFAKAKG